MCCRSPVGNFCELLIPDFDAMSKGPNYPNIEYLGNFYIGSCNYGLGRCLVLGAWTTRVRMGWHRKIGRHA